MLWSLLRTATQRGFSSNPLYRLHLQSSTLCKISSVRFVGNSRQFWNGSQRRTICSRYYKELELVNGSISQQPRCQKRCSSLIPVVNRRFAATRAGSNTYLSASHMRNKTTAIYIIALAVTVVGLSYLSVPLYRLYCQVSVLVGQASFVNLISPLPTLHRPVALSG